jgi:ubiquinone/menaquinone biosynthesis C-methylase UbiE
MPAAFDPDAFTAESRQNWSAVSDSYGRMAAELFPPITAAFLEFLDVRPGQRLLDVACGAGAFAEAAAGRVGPTGRVVGVDLSPGMLKLAASRAASGSLEYREMNAEALDFPDALFDAVSCQLGLMLFARPAAALSEMARVCRKGGAVACLVQGSPDKMLFTSLLLKTLVRIAPEVKQPGAPTLYSFAAPGVLEGALESAGLRSVVSRRAGGTFLFPSFEAYWSTLTEGGGRTGKMLLSLPPEQQEAVRAQTRSLAEAYRRDGGLELPYEIVMAKGLKA